jgi:hypothetical protein
VAVPSATAITLTWDAPAQPGGIIYDYVIRYRSAGSATYSTRNDGVSSKRTTTITGLQPGATFSIVVAATTLAGTGTYSPPVVVTTLSGVATAPTALAATATTTTLSLRWRAPTTTNGSSITDYVVRYRAAGASAWLTLNDGVRTTTTATIAGLTRNKRYDVEVKALTRAGATTRAGAVVTARFATQRR